MSNFDTWLLDVVKGQKLDADYTTNSPSYYDDLSKRNQLMKLLAEKIWNYDQELAIRFAAWDKNLEEFDSEVIRLLEEWIDDGTFADIINQQIFSRKVDDTDFNEMAADVTEMDLLLRHVESGKVDKNGSGQITMQNIGQDIRDFIATGAMPMLGIDSVLNENISNNAIRIEKIHQPTQKRILSNGINGKPRQEVLFDEHSKNLFNRETVTTGLLQLINGVESVNTSSQLFFHSDFIKVEPNTRYWSYLLYAAEGAHEGNEYDSNFQLKKQITPDVPGVSLTGSFVTGAETSYVRVNGPYSLLTDFYLVKTETKPASAAGLERHGYGKIKKLLVDGKQIVSEINPNFLPSVEPINLFDKRKAQVGGLTSTGLGSNEGLLASDFLRVRTGQKLYFNYAYSTTGYGYNEDFTSFLSFGTGYTNVMDEGDGWYSITIPENVKYYRYQLGKNVENNFMLINTEKRPSRYIPYGIVSTPPVASDGGSLPLKDQRIITIGDSNTWLDGTTVEGVGVITGYQNVLRDHGAIVTNRGNSGATFRRYVAGVSNMQHGSLYQDIVVNGMDFTNQDIAVIFSSTNDVGRGLSLGVVDGTNPDRTLDALSLIIRYMLTNNPELKIYLFTPPYRKDKQPELKTMNAGLDELRKYFNLPFKNLLEEGGVNSLNADVYLYDTVHYNNKGQYLLGQQALKTLTSK